MATFYATITERVKIEADSWEEAQEKLLEDDYEHVSWEQEMD
jgi:hypothetical protein